MRHPGQTGGQGPTPGRSHLVRDGSVRVPSSPSPALSPEGVLSFPILSIHQYSRNCAMVHPDRPSRSARRMDLKLFVHAKPKPKHASKCSRRHPVVYTSANTPYTAGPGSSTKSGRPRDLVVDPDRPLQYSLGVAKESLVYCSVRLGAIALSSPYCNHSELATQRPTAVSPHRPRLGRYIHLPEKPTLLGVLGESSRRPSIIALTLRCHPPQDDGMALTHDYLLLPLHWTAPPHARTRSPRHRRIEG
jgi:hypothetical protein